MRTWAPSKRLESRKSQAKHKSKAEHRFQTDAGNFLHARKRLHRAGAQHSSNTFLLGGTILFGGYHPFWGVQSKIIVECKEDHALLSDEVGRILHPAPAHKPEGETQGQPHPCTGNSSRATDRRLIQWQSHITDKEAGEARVTRQGLRTWRTPNKA